MNARTACPVSTSSPGIAGTREPSLLVWFQVARSENQLEKQRRGNRQASANVCGVMHVASAKETTKVLHIMGDKPTAIAGEVDHSGLMPTVRKACERNRQREGSNHGQRPDQCPPHERRRALHETGQAAENTQRYSHPPRCQKPHYACTKAIGEINVEQTELDKFEFCKIFIGDRIADLIVYDAE